jgi:hypothetical protein
MAARFLQLLAGCISVANNEDAIAPGGCVLISACSPEGRFFHTCLPDGVEPTSSEGADLRVAFVLDRLWSQYWDIRFVALSNQERSATRLTISIVENHLVALGAGFPRGFSKPALVRIGTSCSAKPSSFPTLAESMRAGIRSSAQHFIANDSLVSSIRSPPYRGF